MTTESNLRTFEFFSCLTKQNNFEHRLFIGTNYENLTPIIERLMLFRENRNDKKLYISNNLIKVTTDKDSKTQVLCQKFDVKENYPIYIVELEGELRSLNVYEIVKIDIFSRNIDCRFKFAISKDEISKYSPYNSKLNSTEKEIILDALYNFFR